MNLILHIAAAAAFVVFGYWLARQRADLMFLRRLMTAKTSPRVLVMSPAAFSAAFARALGIGFGDGPGGAKPVRVELGPWAELLSVSSPRLIRWSDGTLTIVVAAAERGAVGGLSGSLSKALGGVPIAVEVSPTQDGVRHAQQS